MEGGNVPVNPAIALLAIIRDMANADEIEAGLAAPYDWYREVGGVIPNSVCEVDYVFDGRRDLSITNAGDVTRRSIQAARAAVSGADYVNVPIVGREVVAQVFNAGDPLVVDLDGDSDD